MLELKLSWGMEYVTKKIPCVFEDQLIKNSTEGVQVARWISARWWLLRACLQTSVVRSPKSQRAGTSSGSHRSTLSLTYQAVGTARGHRSRVPKHVACYDVATTALG